MKVAINEGQTMNTPSTAVEPIVLDEADAPLDGWDVPAVGAFIGGPCFLRV